MNDNLHVFYAGMGQECLHAVDEERLARKFDKLLRQPRRGIGTRPPTCGNQQGGYHAALLITRGTEPLPRS